MVDLSERIAALSPEQRALLERRLAATNASETTTASAPCRRHARSCVLSFSQQRLWFLDQFEPGSSLYNVPGAFRLTGSLDIRALEQSLSTIIRRHEALRTTFSLVDGEPIQIVHEPPEQRLDVVDLSALEEAPRRHEADRLIQEEAQRPFDLRQGPMFRARLLRLGAKEHILLLTLHHIVSDGWSQGVLRKELSALYNAFSQCKPNTLPELPIQYADYAAWQRQWLQGETLERQISYWKQNLHGAPDLLELPTDRPRPAVQSFQGALKRLELPPKLTQSVNLLSQREGATQFMTLLAAFQVLLYRYSGQEDIVVGTPIANRPHSETEDLIGFFMNTLALRGDLSGDPTFQELLSRVRTSALRAYAHQDLPFEKLVEELQPERSMSHSPLFQVMFTVQNVAADSIDLHGLQVTTAGQGSVTAKFDLTFGLSQHSERLYGWVEYNTDLFDEVRIERLLGHYRTLLEGIAAKPNERISRLPLLTQPERDQLLVEWNDTACNYPNDCCLHQLFEQQVLRTPEAVALVFAGEELTYSGLNARANQLARFLQQQGVRPNTLAAVCMARSVDMVIALLAILKAGGAYVAVDPAYPVDRIRYTVQDAAASFLITQEALLAQLPVTDALTVCPDRDAQSIRLQPTDDLPCSSQSTDLAYVLYTSGSTGRPKGVAIEHHSPVALVCWALSQLTIQELSGVVFATSICFDLSVYELFVTLCGGGRVLLVENALAIGSLGEELSPSLINTVPSAMAELLRQGAVPSTVMRVNLAGEPLTASLVDAIYDQTDVLKVYDLYGPSEDTTYSTYALREHGGPVTIGRPIANTQTYVLNRNLCPVPLGVSGELYIGGAGLGRGYLNRPDLTAERFVPDPFSGESGARLYRTGDLVRYRSDSNLEYLGRLDHQVKIRGFRIELGEIESALLGHMDVQEATVLAREDVPGEKRLVAYVVGKINALSVSQLQEYLHNRLPAYMVPSAFVEMEQLPLTPNGKVDRNALQAPDASGLREDAYVAPRTPIEEGLAETWAAILHVERVGVHDSFFALGGHSLLATQVISRIRNTFQVDLPLRALFESPTIARLAELIDAADSEENSSVPPLLRVSRDKPLPLSFAQQRLWFLDQFEPGSSLYNIPMSLHLAGALNREAMQQSLCEMVRRHESLRTSFSLTNGTVEGDPIQVIRETSECSLAFVDLRGLEDGHRNEEAHRLVQEEALHPFDLQQGPLFRASLLCLADEEHILLLTLHHIVSDGWSQGVLRKELSALYNGFCQGKPCSLPELPIQYADYAAWQRNWLQGDALAQQIDYWKKKLQGAPTLLELPTDRPRPPVQTFCGARSHFEISAEVTQALRVFSQREGATQFMTLLAAFQVLLSRYSGQEDIVVGTPIANRTQSETEGLVGFFVNTLALRGDLSGNPSFKELLGRVREAALGAYAHQDLPFEKLVEELQPERSMSHSPLFQVMFTLMNADGSGLHLAGLDISNAGGEEVSAKFDLGLGICQHGEKLLGVLDYNTDLFDADRMDRMVGHFQTLLHEVVTNPDQKILRIPILTAPERRQAIVEWNDASVVVPDLRLHQLVETQVDRSPDATAVRFNDMSVSYCELDERANQLAHYLRSHGIGSGDYVGVAMERSVELVVALLGVLKAGAAYVPIDPGYPRDRVEFMLGNACTSMLLSQQNVIANVPVTGLNVLCLDRDWSQVASEPTHRPMVAICAEEPAYVIYTSGSTGRPKGVVISHQAIVNRMEFTLHISRLFTDDRLLQKTPISFDASVWECWAPLVAGAELVLARSGGHTDPAYLVRTIREQRITVIVAVPSLLQMLLHEDGFSACESLRWVICGGEALTSGLQASFFDLFNNRVALHNLYGPTEAAIDSTSFVCSPNCDRVAVPIGRPLPNILAYVLGPDYELLPVGIPGELFVGGIQLAHGYLRRADLTAEKFVPDPFSSHPGGRLYRTGDLCRYRADGNLEYLGRLDHQVKIRGFRIELGEIESALQQHPGVREAVVLAREDVPGDKRLAAYIGSAESGLSGAILREHLLDKLPGYMVPSAFVILEALPLSPNGKIDSKVLPAPDANAVPDDAYGAPQSPIEELLLEIWGGLLHRDRVGVHQNFFELGGHSLLATQVMSRIRNTFQIELPLRTIFETPTVAEIARQIVALQLAGEGLHLPPLTRTSRVGDIPLSFAQQRLWFIDQLQPESSLYNMPRVVRLRGALSIEALQHAFAEIIGRHEVLRTSFVEKSGTPFQIISERTDFSVPICDLSDTDGSEQEELAKQLCIEEANRGFDLACGPMIRAQVLRLGLQDHLLLLTMHHIASDGWSTSILWRELSHLYNSFVSGEQSSLPDLPLQYADYASWQRGWLQGDALQSQVEYWQRRLSGAPQVLKLPSDHPREDATSFEGGMVQFSLSDELTQSLCHICRDARVTPFMALLSALNVLLYRWTGQPDLVVGTDVANRTQAQSEGLIGFFLNHLVLRTDMGRDPSFRALVDQVREVCLGAYAHQDLPFDKLVEVLQPERGMSDTPVFQVLFVVQNVPKSEVNWSGLSIESVPGEHISSKYDLSLFMGETRDGYVGAWVYRTDLFERHTVVGLSEKFLGVLAQVLQNPDMPIEDVELVSETVAERERAVASRAVRIRGTNVREAVLLAVCADSQ